MQWSYYLEVPTSTETLTVDVEIWATSNATCQRFTADDEPSRRVQQLLSSIFFPCPLLLGSLPKRGKPTCFSLHTIKNGCCSLEGLSSFSSGFFHHFKLETLSPVSSSNIGTCSTFQDMCQFTRLCSHQHRLKRHEQKHSTRTCVNCQPKRVLGSTIFPQAPMHIFYKIVHHHVVHWETWVRKHQEGPKLRNISSHEFKTSG